MSTHARRRDEASICEALELVLFLFAPDLRGHTGAVEDTVDVDLHHFGVVRELAVHHGSLGPRDSRVRYENIQSIVELFGLGDYGFFDSRGVCDVYLVGFACGEVSVGVRVGKEYEFCTLDVELFLNLLGSCQRFLIAVVPYHHVCSRFSEPTSDC